MINDHLTTTSDRSVSIVHRASNVLDGYFEIMVEPGATPSSEPSPESLRESEPTTGLTKYYAFPNAEPELDVSEVGEMWQVAFRLHWTGFASCFALLTLFNIYQLSRTCRRKRMPNRGYVFIVQQLVIVFGLSRSLALSFSPYGQTNNVAILPTVIPRILFGLGFPCLVSGFTFVHYIFLQISKVEILSSRNLFKHRCVAAVLVIHFLTVLTSEVITSCVHGTGFLLIICAFYYFAGCLAISLSLLFSGRKLIKRTRQVQENLSKFRLRELGNGENVSKATRRHGTPLELTTITATAVVSGLFGSILYVYSLVWMFRVTLGDHTTPSPWIWLVVNTLVRVCELVLAVTMSYAVCHGYRENM